MICVGKVISTSESAVKVVCSDLSKVNGVLGTSEESRACKASNIKRTHGFTFVKDVALTSKSASGSTKTASTLTLTGVKRIQGIHSEIDKADKKSAAKMK